MPSASYADRNRLLRSMGFSSYVEYLHSPIWDTIKREVFRLRGHKCCICRRRAHQVHHLSYSLAVLRGRSLKELVPICRRCHDLVEVDRQGQKRDLPGAQQTFKDLYRREIFKRRGGPSDRYIRVTYEFLVAGQSARGGLLKDQLLALGAGYPPRPGWKDGIIGTPLTVAEARRFFRAHKS